MGVTDSEKESRVGTVQQEPAMEARLAQKGSEGVAREGSPEDAALELLREH